MTPGFACLSRFEGGSLPGRGGGRSCKGSLRKVINFHFALSFVVVKDGSDNFQALHMSELKPKQTQRITLHHGDYSHVCWFAKVSISSAQSCSTASSEAETDHSTFQSSWRTLIIHTVPCTRQEQLRPCPMLASNLSDPGTIVPRCGCCFSVQRTRTYELISQIISINYSLMHPTAHQN